MAIDPKKWIYGFLSDIPSAIATPLRWATDRVFGVFTDGVVFTKWIKSGVVHWTQRGLAHLSKAGAFGLEVVNTLTWVVLIFVPQRIAAAVTALRTWTLGQMAKAANAVLAALNALKDWAVAQVNNAFHLIAVLRAFVTVAVNALVDKVNAILTLWGDRLSDPEKFAEWLVGALMGPLWRYVYGKRDAIAAWFLRSSPSFGIWLAKQLEDIIGRVL